MKEDNELYQQARNRISKLNAKYYISDKEIIECLVEEINSYRDKIRRLENTIHNKNIESEEQLLYCGEEKYRVTKWYENEVLVKETIEHI